MSIVNEKVLRDLMGLLPNELFRKHLFIECDPESGGRLKVGKYTQFP